jgi:hypothetical protein
MRKLVKFALLMVLLVPAAASAQLSLGARLGYGIPMGDAEDTEDGSLKDGISGIVPLQLEVGYKLTPALTLGGYVSGAYGFVGDQFEDECDTSGVDCSARVWRVGAQLLYSFANASPSFAPWIGVGAGYEWASIKLEGGGEEAKVGYDGFEFLNLQAGADWKAGGNLSFGPFIMFSLGQYSNFDVESPAGDFDGDIEEKAMHQWLTIGLRGTLDI